MRRSRFDWLAAAAAILGLSLPAAAWAQTNFGSSSGSVYGGTSSSTNYSGLSSGSSSMGSSSSGSRSSGSSGSSGTFGNRSLGQGVSAGQRTMGRGTQSGTGMMSGLGSTNGQVNSSNRFLRNNRQGAFVGADTRDNTSALLGGQTNSTTGSNSRGYGSSMSMGFGGMNRNSLNRLQGMMGGYGNMQQRTEVRTALSIGFDYPHVAADKVSTGLSQRLSSVQGLRTLAPVQVGLAADGTVVLRGVVASQRDRALAERLALLEPGVWKVQNELEVSAPAPAAASTPAPGPAALPPTPAR